MRSGRACGRGPSQESLPESHDHRHKPHQDERGEQARPERHDEAHAQTFRGHLRRSRVVVREARLGQGGLDAFLHEYQLSSREGVVLIDDRRTPVRR